MLFINFNLSFGDRSDTEIISVIYFGLVLVCCFDLTVERLWRLLSECK